MATSNEVLRPANNLALLAGISCFYAPKNKLERCFHLLITAGITITTSLFLKKTIEVRVFI